MSKILKKEVQIKNLLNELIELLGDDEDEVMINALGFIRFLSLNALQRARDLLRKK
ncbi:hypothetical protein ES705_43729 [subsurface metagenome]